MLLLPSALASTPLPSLQAAIQEHPGARFALACAPLGDLADLLGRLPSGTVPSKAEGAEALFHREGLAQAGVDPDGAMVVLLADSRGKEGWFSLDFRGTPAQVETLARALDLSLQADGDGWTIDEDRVELRDGRLIGGRWPADLDAEPLSLDTGIEDRPGCTLAMVAPSTQRAFRELQVQVPFGDAPVTALVRTTEPAPSVFEGAPTSVIAASSTARPSAVITVGVPLDGVIDAVTHGPLGASVAMLVETRERVSFPSGLTLALFDEGGASKVPPFALVTAIRSTKGKKLPPKALAAAIARTNDRARDTGRGTFELSTSVGDLYGAALRNGNIVLASTAGLRDDVARGGAASWVEKGGVHHAFPIAASGVWNGLRVEGTLTARAGAWEVGVRTGAHTAEDLVTLAASSFSQFSKKAETAGVLADVDGIRVAELAYDAAFDTFIVATDAPRLRTEVDSKKVKWTTSEGFSALGWRPDGDVAAVYWVDVVEGQFTVHARVDADGDGVPAEATATLTEAARWITPEGVR